MKKIITIISIQGVVVLLGLELILWIIFPIGLRQKYSQTTTQNLPGLKSQVTYDRNEFGFRSVSMKHKEKLKNTFRIICLGASTTDQTTQNTEDTWSGILEKLLNNEFRQTGYNVEVAAYGRGGITITDQLQWAKENLLSYDPDVVVTLEGVNDLTWKRGYPDEELEASDGGKGIKKQKPSLISSTLGFCSNFSQICRRTRIVKQNMYTSRALKSGHAVEWHSEHLQERRLAYRGFPSVENPIRDPDSLEEFSNGMKNLLEFLLEENIEVVVLGQPVLWKENMTEEEKNALWFYIATPSGNVKAPPDWMQKQMEKYNNVQKSLAHSLKVSYIGLDEMIPKTLEYYFDDCHYTDLGSRKVAESIYPALQGIILKKLSVVK